MTSTVDEKYYQAVKPKGVSERLLIRARAGIYQDFVARMQPQRSDRIVDVGVSDVINDGANVLERAYPYPEQVTACGLSEAAEFKAAYPRCKYVRIEPNARLPFGDEAFDIATSNAVLEHVGSFENQVHFMKELCRVARRVFISVPNRYFPVEHHTALPLLHFDERLFSMACSITGRSEWTQEENLILMTRKRLWQIAATVTKSAAVGYTGIRLGAFSSNIFIAFH